MQALSANGNGQVPVIKHLCSHNEYRHLEDERLYLFAECPMEQCSKPPFSVVFSEDGTEGGCNKCLAPREVLLEQFGWLKDSPTVVRSKSSWSPIDLTHILSGDTVRIAPVELSRSDGQCIFYKGEVHVIYGEPGIGKSFLSQWNAATCLQRGLPVAYFDFEDNEHSLVSRLLGMGATNEQILAYFRYVRPSDPLNTSEADKRAFIEAANGAHLAVFDGVTESATLEGLSYIDNTDMAKWLERFARPVARMGTVVQVIDHVTRDKDKRNGGPIGAQVKKSGTYCTYEFKTVDPWYREKSGSFELICRKDRGGWFPVDKPMLHGDVFVRDGAVRDIRLHPPLEIEHKKTDSGAEKYKEALRSAFYLRAVEALREKSPQGRDTLLKYMHDKAPLGIEWDEARDWLKDLAQDPTTEIESTLSKGYFWVDPDQPRSTLGQP